MVDNEQPPHVEETKIDNSQIVIEAPGVDHISRNKIVNVFNTTSVRSSVVRNKAPSMMSSVDSPRLAKESGGGASNFYTPPPP